MSSYSWNRLTKGTILCLTVMVLHAAVMEALATTNPTSDIGQNYLERWLPVGSENCPAPLHLLILQNALGKAWIRWLDLRMLGWDKPEVEPQFIQGERYYPLENVTGLRRSKDGNHIKIHPASPHLCDRSLSDSTPETLLLSVTVNQKPLPGVTFALRTQLNQLLLPKRQFEKFRTPIPQGIHYLYDNEAYIPLNKLPGVTYKLNQRTLTLDLAISPDFLEPTTVSVQPQPLPKSVESDRGAFLNYDIHSEYRIKKAENTARHAGVLELGIFGKSGVLTHTGLFRHDNNDKQWLRLETRWRQDYPEKMRTLVLGDQLARSGSWSQPVRYAGLSWGTNFSTRPDLMTFPLPSLAGKAATASTVDVYVDNIRRATTDVPAGPFTIDDLPIITGAGEIKLVTRDLLGRDRVTTHAFYGSRELLRSGLYDYQISAGVLRQKYGQRSNQYEDFFGSSTHRFGITQWLTGELHAQITEEFRTVGATASIALPHLGALHWAKAYSLGPQNDQGQLTEIRWERNGPTFSFGIRRRAADSHFQQISNAATHSSLGRTNHAYTGVHLGRFGSFSISYLDRYADKRTSRLFGLGYSAQLGGWGSLSVSASKSIESNKGNYYRASLVIPFGNNFHATSSADFKGNRERLLVGLRRTPDAKGGLGVRAEQQWGERRDRELHAELQTRSGTFTTSAVQRLQTNAYRLGARGGFAYLGNRLLASDWISGSFAAVHVPNLPGLPLYRDNIHLTETNEDGWALIPGLRAFEQNRVTLDLRDLPLDVQMNGSKDRALVPGFRRGLVVTFNAQKSHAAVVTLTDTTGEPLPPGTSVINEQTGETFSVGWDGMTYITGLSKQTRLTARWRSGRCHLTLAYPKTDDPLPELGTYVCHN